MRCDARRQPNRRGSGAVETAVTLLLFITFMFAVFEYGRYTMIRHLVVQGAREGCRLAVTDPNYYWTGSAWASQTLATVDIQNAAFGMISNLQLVNKDAATLTATSTSSAGTDIDVYQCNSAGTKGSPSTWTSATTTDYIAVEVKAYYQPMLPTFGFLPSLLPVNAKVIMASEANQ